MPRTHTKKDQSSLSATNGFSPVVEGRVLPHHPFDPVAPPDLDEAGLFGAVHGTDVSASFYNLRDGIAGVGSAQAKVVWAQLASAWVAFAKTGDPNNARIPKWSAYDSTTRATMVFDNDTHAENDPRGEIRRFWNEMPLPAARRG